MGDMTASYYHPPPSSSHYPSHYPPPPPPGAAAPPPQPSVTHPYPHHYQHHQPQYSIAYSHPPPAQLHGDEVRTLFIAGLPEDSKPREIYNLFREFPGYQSSQLRNSGKSSQAYAFAVFSDQQSAIAAMHTLNGMIFDLEKESSLYVELAKSNSRTKRSRTDDEVVYYSDKRVRGPIANSRGFPDLGSGSNIHMPGMGNSAYSLHGYPSAQSHANFDKEYVNDRDPSGLNSTAFLPQNNSACPTLFVANLGPTCSEQELAQAFSRCPGFLKLKMQNKYGIPVAFVDFQDVESSTAALNHLQGTILYSSVGEGMRLEYAKSRMGLRKRQKRT
ncbi:RNA-binding protein L [Typha latifolia]|uniref:RNA-binding protein L n=1 Tax=Typha latifolia TaxID=4733 RepID=UPI003C2D60E5